MFSKHQKPHISKEKPKISVIIPAYNEEDRLGQLSSAE
jgi:cellulose synthase/poly-beta-1,6-N-acetylglucosamine synthase-like glycosyltransferase